MSERDARGPEDYERHCSGALPAMSSGLRPSVETTEGNGGALPAMSYSAAFATGSNRASKWRMDFSTVSAICLSLSWWTTFRPNRSFT